MGGRIVASLVIAVVGSPALLAYSEVSLLLGHLARGHAGTSLIAGGLLAGAALDRLLDL